MRLSYWGLGIVVLGIIVSQSSFAYIDERVLPLEGISGYKPTYFLSGRPDTKVQLSFKAQLIKAAPLFFSYTQLMIWELFEHSSPFREIDYNPAIFYRLRWNHVKSAQWVDIGLFEHESNGQAGDTSRSWDRFYLLYSDQLAGTPSGRNAVFLSFKAWVPYAEEPADLPRYRGLWSVTLSLSGFLGRFWDRDEVIFRLYPGGSTYLNPFQGGQELTLRMKLHPRTFLPLFVFQVFHGYGEDLLDAQQDRLGIRAGLGF